MSKALMPVGYDSFEELRSSDFYYVDKSLLVKQLLSKKSMVTLITRPRRFGKSLNMSMLECFFDIRKDSKDLFKNLEISKETEICNKWLNKYPTVFITLKGVGRISFNDAYDKLIQVTAQLYDKHSYLFDSSDISETDRIAIDNIRKTSPRKVDLTNSLFLLTKLMYKYYGKKVILLIDEYDVPMSKGNSYGYYEKITDIIRAMFDDALKTNEYLAFAVLTGCLRISKESIFTGLNNPDIDSISDDRYDEYFGFTDSEVDKLLSDTNLVTHKDIIKEWYDGYHFGDVDVYCPWDVMCYVSRLLQNPHSKPKPFWANTTGTDIIRPYLHRNRAKISDYFTTLLRGDSVKARINERLTYGDLYSNDLDSFWSILYLTGYLTPTSIDYENNIFELRIPNKEIKMIFEESISNWFKNDVVPTSLGEIVSQLWNCEGEKLGTTISKLLFRSISSFDYSEAFYHAFLAGVLVLTPYDVKSNRENGEGRTDITVIDDENIRAAVFEFKIADKKEQLDSKCITALEQIDSNKYAEELIDKGYTEVLKCGVAFCKKTCKIKIIRN